MPLTDGVACGSGERVVSLLRRLVRINTEHAAPAPGAPYGEGCARALSLVLDECAARGFSTVRLSDELAWAEVGRGDALAAFPVHLDVVPAGDGWTHDPYGAEVVDGVLYGRGCMDNKIAVALLIELVDELARAHGGDLPCRFRIIFGTDEETGMRDVAGYLAAGGEQPTLGFVPDATFPAVRGEKARVALRVTRPGRTEGLAMEAGLATNSVPAEARAEVDPSVVGADVAEALVARAPAHVDARLAGGSVLLAAHGRAAHGSTPERGRNAAALLVGHLVACGAGATWPSLALVNELLCGDTRGARLGVDVPDPVFGGTSVNLGTLEMTPAGVEATLDIRMGGGLDPAEAARRVASSLGEGWSVETLGEKPLHLVDEDDANLRALLDAYAEVTGMPTETTVMAGGTYASLFPALAAFGPKLPGRHSGGHGADEHVSLEDIFTAARVYRAALRNIAALAAAGR